MPQRLLSATLAASGVLFAATGIAAGFSLRHAATLRSETAKMQNLSIAIAHLDESLTMSVRMATVSGESRWTTRYQQSASQFLETLRQIRELSPTGEAAHNASDLVTAGKTRVATERHMLALADSGRIAEARSLLGGSGYESQKRGFARVNAAVTENAQLQIQDSAQIVSVSGLVAGVAATAALGLMFGSVGAVRRSGSRLRGDVFTAQQALQKAQEDLKTVRQQAETKTRESAQFRETLAVLERQMIGRDQLVDRQMSLLESAVEAANDVVMIADNDNGIPRVVRVNKAFERMTGYTAENICGRSPKILQGPATDEAVLADMRTKLHAGEAVRAELINYRKDGSPFWVELNIQPIFNAQGHLTSWISIQRDVTEQRKAAEEIWWRANFDSLTRLPNRSLYQTRLGEAIEQAESRCISAGILFFDLDRFKQINDTLGHMTGDVLLQQVAQRLSACLRPDDTIARIGGDEFTILQPNITNTEEVSQLAQSLLDALDAPFHLDGHELFVTASIGISIAPKDGHDITTLLKNADAAMYRAKDQGRDSFCIYNENMNARALDRLHLETHLRRALERNELYLLYQPQVDLATGELFGVEALMRWENPVLGRVSPGQFIPIAETMEDKLINALGQWTLHQACQQAAQWRKMGRCFRMSVNLSARQFSQPDLPAIVAEALRVSGLPAELLDIEITESTLVKMQESTDNLHSLKKLGVHLSVDDFGIGYSSLSYLRTLPLDILKIDRSFVMDLGEDRKGEAVVQKLVELAHDLGLEVIAEGVETEIQKMMLQRMRCNAMQGYLFSPPTTPADIEILADDALLADPVAPVAPVKLRLSGSHRGGAGLSALK